MIEIEVFDDAVTAAARAAEEIATRARAAVADHGRFTFAVSGGSTPLTMFTDLGNHDVPWDRVAIYQVDERVAPAGDTDRNLTHLVRSLPPDGVAVVLPMPVEDADLEEAAGRYAATLPDRFDLVHLGIGPDGHTASLVPDDPVLGVTDRDVALTEPYQGRRRMTVTYPVLDRAELVLWLVAGEEKADALARLRVGDASVPAGRVRASTQLVFCDRAAAG